MVRVQAERQAAAGSMAPDRRHHGNAAGGQPLIQERHVGELPVVPGQPLQRAGCAAHAERLLGAGQHHRADRRVAVDGRECGLQAGQQRRREHIVVLDVLHAHQRHAIVQYLQCDDVAIDALVHGFTSL
ncbi:hypothetical protein GCM10011572_17070 [Pseudoduganella buxea]|uniref:Uncharacterized protein n=1 Tax=Pseudoduganella buxea TaxID=1949069 RepID=A0ABQ1KFC3_9BURK|nr:hypothetical protein GCM10011572_17070 [Pseudoduganella buxea]